MVHQDLQQMIRLHFHLSIKQKFYHVPIYRNHDIPILGTTSVELENVFLDQDEMNDLNNADPEGGFDSSSSDDEDEEILQPSVNDAEDE